MSRTTLLRRAITATAASALVFTATGTAAADPTDPATPAAEASSGMELPISGPIDRGLAPAGSVRAEFSAPGPHPVAATIETRDCHGLIVRAYNEIVHSTHGVVDPPRCYGVFPDGSGSPVGVQWFSPADLAEGETAPLVILSPGIGAQPSQHDRLARFLASHGYIVGLGYTYINWFGVQMNMAAISGMEANRDPINPLAGHIDFSRTALVGHSAGGGSALSMSRGIEGVLGSEIPELDVKAVVAHMPGPGDMDLLFGPGSAPTLVTLAEHEMLAPKPLAEIRYAQLTGPGWLATIRNSYHGTPLDRLDNAPVAGLTLSFLQAFINGDPKAAAYYEGPDWKLAHDPELEDVTRTAAAAEL